MTKLEAFQNEFQERGKKIAEMEAQLQSERRELSKLVQNTLGVNPDGNISIEAVLNLVTNTVRLIGERVDG